MPLPRAAVALLLAVALAGCAETGLGSLGGKAANGPRATPVEVRAVADEAAAEWNPRASLLAVTAEQAKPQKSVFRASTIETQARGDGKMASWKFTYVVPASVSMFMAEVGGDGELLDTRRLDLSRFSPEVGGYGEYFALTGIEDAWLDTPRLVELLAPNATGLLGDVDVDSIAYTLRPDVRDLYAWRVTVAVGDRAFEGNVNPRTWEVYGSTYDDGIAPVTAGGSADATPSGLLVEQVYGTRDDSGNIARLTYYLELGPGARPLDLAALAIATQDATFRHDDGFTVTWLRGERDGTTLVQGALASVTFDLPRPIGPREELAVELTPPRGTPVDGGFRAPATFGNAQIVPLR